jgi:hypothetical protein
MLNCKMDTKHCELQIPNDKKIIDTPIAYFWRGDKDIIYSVGKPDARDFETIEESVQILAEELHGKKVCLITDTSNTAYYSIEMRNAIARLLAPHIKAAAFVPCTETGKVMAEIVFTNKVPFPAKIFNDLKEAEEWIEQFC